MASTPTQTVLDFDSLLQRAIEIVGGDAFDRRAQEEFGRLSFAGDEAILSWPRADDAMGYWLHLFRQEARFPARLLTASTDEVEAWRQAAPAAA
jgi:hypothetical protein